LFLISSWMPLMSLDLLKVTVMTCCILASASLAETETVRLGAHFRDAAGNPFQRLGSVSEALNRQKLDMQQFVKGFDDCQALVAGPIESATPRDSLRDTWTVIQTISVECWALLQIAPSGQVTAAGPSDRITMEMIHEIMANADRLSAEDEDWAKTLIVFTGGEVACKDRERCRLSLPDGKSPPEQSLDFEVIMAIGDERFILVTQMIYGRSGFVYGVLWRDAGGGGQVVKIFPDLS
jgi:hypothetical protein